MKKEQKNNTWKIIGIVAGAFVLCAAVVGAITGGNSEQTPAETERPEWAAWYPYAGDTEQPDADLVVELGEISTITGTATIEGLVHNNLDRDISHAKVVLGFYDGDVKLDECDVHLYDLGVGKNALSDYCVYERGSIDHDAEPTIKVEDVEHF